MDSDYNGQGGGLLTERQRQVVLGLERGLTFAGIAVELGLSARTVKAHADVIRAKLGVDKARLIVPAARREGLL